MPDFLKGKVVKWLFLKGKVVKWLFDSQSSVLIIQPGSSKPELHKEPWIFSVMFLIITALRVDWIPREFYKTADSLSKMSRTEEREVTQYFSSHVDQIWERTIQFVLRLTITGKRKRILFESLVGFQL